MLESSFWISFWRRISLAFFILLGNFRLANGVSFRSSAIASVNWLLGKYYFTVKDGPARLIGHLGLVSE